MITRHFTLLLTCMFLVISVVSGCDVAKTNSSGTPNDQTKTFVGTTTPATSPAPPKTDPPTDVPPPPPVLTKSATSDLPAKFQPISIAFSNANEGVMVGVSKWDDDQSLSEIAITTDGGHTWKAVAQINRIVGGLSVEGHDVYASTGVQPDGRKYLLSKDGGQTWNLLPDDQKFAGSRTYREVKTAPCTGEWSFGEGTLSFPTEQQGWALCVTQGGAGNMGKAIFATTDGGQSWQPMLQVHFGPNATSGGIGTYGYPTGIFFLSDSHGWLWENRGGLFATTDGGRNWRSVGITQPESVEAKSVWFLSDSTGFVLRSDYGKSEVQLLMTNDGSKTWSVVQTWKYN